MFCKKLKCYRNSHRRCSVKIVLLKISQLSQETPVLESLFNKVAGLQGNYIKKISQHRYFPVNNAKFLRTSILKNICVRLLLVFCKNRNVTPKFSSYIELEKKGYAVIYDALFEEEFTIPYQKI